MAPRARGNARSRAHRARARNLTRGFGRTRYRTAYSMALAGAVCAGAPAHAQVAKPRAAIVVGERAKLEFNIPGPQMTFQAAK
jgi:hypothetical protein